MTTTEADQQAAFLLEHGWAPAQVGTRCAVAIERALAASRRVFELDLVEKERHSFPEADFLYGWNPKGLAEGRESWQVSDSMPEEAFPAPERPALPTLIALLDEVARQCSTLLRQMIGQLGLQAPAWADQLTAGSCQLRMLRYAAGHGQFDTHVDLGAFTVFLGSSARGLEFLDVAGRWVMRIPAVVPGTLVEHLTAGTVTARPHRVRPVSKERYSVVAFVHPLPDVVIDAQIGMTAGEFFAKQMRSSGYRDGTEDTEHR